MQIKLQGIAIKDEGNMKNIFPPLDVYNCVGSTVRILELTGQNKIAGLASISNDIIRNVFVFIIVIVNEFFLPDDYLL